MPTIPTPIRAALGLAVTAVAEARKLPETLPQLPVAAVTTAMQASLRVQQHIATLAARGDEAISHLRGSSEQAPPWAKFDDEPARRPSHPAAAFDRAGAQEDPADDLADDLTQTAPGLSPATDPAAAPPAKAAPAKAAPATPAKGAPAASAAPAKAAPTKAAAKKAPAKKAAKKSEPLVEAAKKAKPAAVPNPSTMAAEIVQAHQGDPLPGE
jgi:hypothetical protein